MDLYKTGTSASAHACGIRRQASTIASSLFHDHVSDTANRDTRAVGRPAFCIPARAGLEAA